MIDVESKQKFIKVIKIWLIKTFAAGEDTIVFSSD